MSLRLDCLPKEMLIAKAHLPIKKNILEDGICTIDHLYSGLPLDADGQVTIPELTQAKNQWQWSSWLGKAADKDPCQSKGTCTSGLCQLHPCRQREIQAFLIPASFPQWALSYRPFTWQEKSHEHIGSLQHLPMSNQLS